MSQVTLQGNASGTGIFTIAAPNSNTNRTVNLPDAGGDVVLADATQTLTNKSISGAQINSGTVAVARLGSGTPTASNFLRGDGSWQTVSTTPTTAQVLTATAGASYGGVGTYAFMSQNVSTTTGISAESNYAGSGLTPSGFYASLGSGNNAVTGEVVSSPAGTWKAMGGNIFTGASRARHTLFLRIS